MVHNPIIPIPYFYKFIMWYRTGKFILQYRIPLMVILVMATAYMGWQASQVQLSYEFSKAVPTDNPRYQEYLAFKNKFGEDGSVLVIGVEDPRFFDKNHFDAYRQMVADIKKVKGVEGIMSVPAAINLRRSDTSEALLSGPLFDSTVKTQAEIDSARALFENLLFYRGLLHNPTTHAYLAGATINKGVLASKDRTRVVNELVAITKAYTQQTKVQAHLSGLPLIRTQIADRIKNEMNYFLIGSLALAAFTLILFFRSTSATLLSLIVVLFGVVWALGTMHLLGYKITLLNALIPPLIIVIGIPNCIYFLNKYHMSWEEAIAKEPAATKMSEARIAEVKRDALLNMVGKMGIVTLFCNIAAAVGFAVFALTESALLKEFGIVAGINIMVIFFISLIMIPVVLSYVKPPKERHTRYLRNKFLENLLVRVEYWVLQRRKLVYAITGVVLVAAVLGMLQLKSVGFIVDDLPKSDLIYTDLKWFEKNFGGVMPLEIVVDTKKKGAVTRNLKTIVKMDELAEYLHGFPEVAKPLSLVEGLKFAKQAYYDGDSLSYMVPNEFDMAFLGPYLKGNGGGDSSSQLSKLTKTFIDSNKQQARISVNMADVGTVRLASLLDSFQLKADTIFNLASLEPVNPDSPDGKQKAIFDTAYHINFTGSSVTYLEGSRFIINGLKESIFWAFLLIALTMLYLFKSVRILLCSLIPNIIPLVVTAGVMGWAGVALKPSTVLVFSVALGIAIDVTIRFLVNYKQELPNHHNNILATTTSTIRHTGISIIYTSLVLVAGFVIFMFSGFGGTFALGWLTSFTLLVATLTNLVFLPVIMLALLKQKPTKAHL